MIHINSILKFSLVASILGFISLSGYGQVVSTVAGISKSSEGVGSMAGFSSPNGVVVDITGNVYVADWGNNKIRKVTPQGSVSTFAGDGVRGYKDGEASQARFDGPNGIAMDAAGNLYVSDHYGSRIRKITPAGVVSTLAGTGSSGKTDGNGTTASFNRPSALAVDGTGTIYVADTYNHMIRKITTDGVVSTIAGNGTSGYADGIGAAAKFSNPSGIALDASGNLYVTDYYNDRIRKITPDGTVSTYASSAGLFDAPYGIAVDAEGNVYFSHSDRIRKISVTGVVSAFAGNGAGSTDGNSSTASFYTPHGLAIDASGTMYVADFQNQKIRKITAQGIVSTLAGAGYTKSVDGTGTEVRFYSPSSVVVDKQGTLYIADQYKVRKLTKNGEATTIAGSDNSGNLDATGAAARFDEITDLALDINGNLFVADYKNNKIRKITPAGVVTTFAGSGVRGIADGNGINAEFNSPFALAFDAQGNLYVSDQSNHCIRKITPNGDVSTFAGKKTSGYNDGNSTDALFSYPAGLDFDKNGNLYIVDRGNYRIRKINPEGTVTTFAGSLYQQGWDGTGTSASFSSPSALCVDGLGNVYVTQESNKIRKITPAAVVTTFAGTGFEGSTNGPTATARFSTPLGIAVDTNYNLYIADKFNYQIRKISLPNDIKVLHANNVLVSGASEVDFGTIKKGNSSTAFSFRIENGNAAMKPLFLLGNPLITVSSNDFIVEQPNTSSSVAIGGFTEFTIIFNPATAGTKTATVTIPHNNLDGDDYTFIIKGIASTTDVTTGIADVQSSSVICYPNPASSQVTLNSPGETLLEVYTLTGIKLMTQQMTQGENLVNIENLPAGLYFFNMPSIDQSVKVIKD